jgi:hypothetical protein
MLLRTVLMALLLAAPAQAATRVYIDSDNVFIERDGVKKQLTSSGRDSEPLLSPDGRFVVFTRQPAKKQKDDDLECEDGAKGDALMRVGADGSGEAILLRGRKGKPDQRLCLYGGKQFSSDGRLLYFQVPAWVTSAALHVYDFKTRSGHFVIDGNALHVLAACRNEHKDRLAIQRHKYFVFGGSYDWYWLYDPVGRKEIGPLGEIEEADLAKRAEEWCAN